MNSQRLQVVFSLLMAGLMFAGDAWPAQAGRVQFVNGDVEVTTAAGATHAVHKGDPVNEGDTITSAKTASAQVKMQDGGFIAVRPDTKLKFDSFKFGGKAGEPENSFFSLFKGGFRAVTGLIGRIRKEDYHITTPVATIGIRGTDHETVLVLPDNPLVAAGQAEPGAYNKVNLGETSITTDKGTINVLPNQMGFAGGLNLLPEIKPINTSLFTVIPKPSPGANMDSGKGGDQGARETAVVDATGSTAGGTTNVTGIDSASELPSIVPPTVVVNPATALGVVTAPFVNTDITWDVASLDLGNGFGKEGPPGNVSSIPNPTSFFASYDCGQSCNQTSSSITLNGGTNVGSSDATTGIQWGYWTGVSSATVIITGTGGSTNTYTSPGVISWITAPASSFILPMALTGTASYSLIGGTATDGTNIGTVNNASLSVDFTKQLVNMTLNASVTVAYYPYVENWLVTGTGASLGSGRGNSGFAFAYNPTNGEGTLSASALLSGLVWGELTGNGLTGAILSYTLSSDSTGSLAGVAALGLSPSTPINTATPYQAALTSMPAILATPYPNSTTPYSVVSDSADGAIFNPATLGLDGAGNPVYFPQISSNMTSALGNTTGAQSGTISGATAMDTGTDPVSGIKWGRWSGGTITYTSLATGATYPLTMPLGGLHWILLPASSGPNYLPVSGTYNYVLAGGTNPTDQSGNVGTLNSASLTANFSTMTVNIAASVTVPYDGITLNGSATGVPIQNGMTFDTKGTSGTTTCTGSCGSVNAGRAVGAFTQNALGAAVTYGMQTGSTLGSPTYVVGGVIAFHR